MKREIVLDLIKTHPGVTSKELSNLLDIPVRTIRGHIQRLLNEKVIIGRTPLFDARKTLYFDVNCNGFIIDKKVVRRENS